MLQREDECVLQAVRGDRDALTRLLERHGPVVWHRLAGQMPRAWQALLTRDDVMQQTYTDAILDVHQLIACSEEAFAAWLFSLARRNLYDAIRMLEAEKRGGRHRRRIGIDAGESAVALYELLGGTSNTASREAARKEAASALETAIQRLPEVYRAVIHCYDLEGRPVEEVAARLNRSKGAVFMLRARAHRRLSEMLGTASKFLSDSS